MESARADRIDCGRVLAPVEVLRLARRAAIAPLIEAARGEPLEIFTLTKVPDRYDEYPDYGHIRNVE